MNLTRIINCLLPINPQVRLINEEDADKSFLLKTAGESYAAIAALIYFNPNPDKKILTTAAVLAGILYLAGAAKEYSALKRAERYQADIQRDMTPFEHNQWIRKSNQ